MKSIKKISLLTALFALVLSFSFSTSQAQVTPPQPETETYLLKGNVVDAQSGVTLADAEVVIVGQDINTLTDQEGKFKLENLPAGDHTLKVTLDGYQPWEKNITLDQDAELEIKLEPAK
ncbi:MAG: carboxypeptidase-like regulatory domain-containing protein [Balneolaceae bacterium]|nr:carboxypeptidase-like regulatory domain-containing protein [Balneolaceae bacterium]